MISAMVVVLDKGGDLSFEVLAEEVIFEQDAVLQCLLPAFDLDLVAA